MDISSDDSSNNDILMVATLIFHDDKHNALPSFTGSMLIPEEIDSNTDTIHVLLYDYFILIRPTYRVNKFWRYFSMSRHVFMLLLEGVRAHDGYSGLKKYASVKVFFLLFVNSLLVTFFLMELHP